MKIVTADLWDEHTTALKVLPLELQNYGGKTAFCGEIVTLKVYEDNSYVRKTLEENGNGKVLVVDGGGSKRCALVGDNIASLANENGWEGIIIYGCIRDSKVIKTMDVGIKAIGTCPVKSRKQNIGSKGETLLIEGTEIVPGNYIYSDEDGILLSTEKLL
ncbi:ribonuclease E activity regulator RraA [Muricauda sp. SCSIO 64092]|uniref:ribonuclease E activity regulator RraA n=1 Tax=Allomuricauda sp. SCSIO 64092 TaxID=2908842 RepID=UPI001FF51231|nr:ribonuclease E activity regulator RraA [Muricauda sp. SCSIO 64092]UOY06421.1 ribonuclease E activity regulator RraA [Muricauda sp. SCSIO 64092]